jgi:hypothetical protein
MAALMFQISKARISLTLATACISALGTFANAEDNLVKFPDGFESGVHYATVNRGSITEELFTSPEAITAAKAGQPMPDGTVITMTDSRNGELYRYVVMQKGKGWGDAFSPDRRTGDWQFQWFNPDKSVRVSENLGRCQSCHQSQSENDFVYTYGRMAAH